MSQIATTVGRLDLALGSASHLRRSLLLEETLHEGHLRATRGAQARKWPLSSQTKGITVPTWLWIVIIVVVALALFRYVRGRRA